LLRRSCIAAERFDRAGIRSVQIAHAQASGALPHATAVGVLVLLVDVAAVVQDSVVAIPTMNDP
jgi:hypothetical protein